MATYDTAGGFTRYTKSTGEFRELGAGDNSFNDGDPTSDNFEAGEMVSLSNSFVGTVMIGGTTYIVVQNSSQYLVMGIQLDSATYPTFSSLGPVDTSNFVTCYLPGTFITTPRGERPVEGLLPGDEVMTAEGKAVPVKWIGRQTVMTRFGPAERLMPVRFAAGCLGEGLPHTDLTVTADHGMLVEGVICHAGALVNGTTITRVPLSEMGETYTVYHVETEEHEIILANGAPAETFIDNVSRRVFDNFAEFEALYGDVPEMEELPYPRAMSARQVPGRIAESLAIRKVA
jgi:hypothetical protein